MTASFGYLFNFLAHRGFQVNDNLGDDQKLYRFRSQLFLDPHSIPGAGWGLRLLSYGELATDMAIRLIAPEQFGTYDLVYNQERFEKAKGMESTIARRAH